MVELVKHLKGSQEAYENLPETVGGGGGYSDDTLYFTTEFSGDTELNTGRIYLGGTLVGKPSVWEELPKPSPYKMVDLGLSVKWADRNVGAENIEDYGDYFMWGSTTPDTDKPCDWAHAPFNNESTEFDEEYFNAHKSEWLTNEGILKPEYDAAHAIMGGIWRMPTSAEIRELIDGTNRESGTIEDVKGMFFVSKTNGNSIFMPFAGYRYGSGVGDVGNRGFVWSSSLNTSDAGTSHSLNILSYELAIDLNDVRLFGFSVRGVC